MTTTLVSVLVLTVKNEGSPVSTAKAPTTSPGWVTNSVVWNTTTDYVFSDSHLNFSHNGHNGHLIARPWQRGMGCHLWARRLMYMLCNYHGVWNIMFSEGVKAKSLGNGSTKYSKQLIQEAIVDCEYSGRTRSTTWLLMPWFLVSPKQVYKIGRSLFSIRKDFYYLHNVDAEKWHKMQIYFFIFPRMNSAWTTT